MSDRLPIVMSVPTSGGGATPGATFSFFTNGYRPPRQDRDVTVDVVHNQNGRFIYPYDNGPGGFSWDQFTIELNDAFSNETPNSATQAWSNLQFLWGYLDGPIGFADYEAVYSVGFAAAPLERQLVGHYPGAAGDKIITRVVVNIEER